MDDSRREQLEAEKRALIEKLKKKIRFSNFGYIVWAVWCLIIIISLFSTGKFPTGGFIFGIIGFLLNYFWNKELQKKLKQAEQQKI